MSNDDPEVKEGEKYCFKCKEIVDEKDFHGFYGICIDCVNKSGTH